MIDKKPRGPRTGGRGKFVAPPVNNTKYKAGDVVTLKVARMAEMGAFLDAGTGNTSDDILLHNQQMEGMNVKVGDEVEIVGIKETRKTVVICTLIRPKD